MTCTLSSDVASSPCSVCYCTSLIVRAAFIPWIDFYLQTRFASSVWHVFISHYTFHTFSSAEVNYSFLTEGDTTFRQAVIKCVSWRSPDLRVCAWRGLFDLCTASLYAFIFNLVKRTLGSWLELKWLNLKLEVNLGQKCHYLSELKVQSWLDLFGASKYTGMNTALQNCADVIRYLQAHMNFP